MLGHGALGQYALGQTSKVSILAAATGSYLITGIEILLAYARSTGQYLKARTLAPALNQFRNTAATLTRLRTLSPSLRKNRRNDPQLGD